MSDSKSFRQLYQTSTEAQDTFDYFICATTGALVAYIVQSYTPQRLALNPSSLEPLAILLLAGSFFLGLKRIEAGNLMKKVTARIHFLADQMSEITTALAEPKPKIDRSGRLLDPTQLAKEREDHERSMVSLEEQRIRVQQTTKTYYQLRNHFLLAGFLAIFVAKLGQPYAQQPTPEPAVNSVSNRTLVQTNVMMPSPPRAP
jgi:hypothetical protein